MSCQPGFDGEPAVNLDAGAEQLPVIRHGLEVVIRALGTGEYAMLRAFAGGKTFGELPTVPLRSSLHSISAKRCAATSRPERLQDSKSIRNRKK